MEINIFRTLMKFVEKNKDEDLPVVNVRVKKINKSYADLSEYSQKKKNFFSSTDIIKKRLNFIKKLQSMQKPVKNHQTKSFLRKKIALPPINNQTLIEKRDASTEKLCGW